MLAGIIHRGGERRIEVTAVRRIRDVLGIVNDLMVRTRRERVHQRRREAFSGMRGAPLVVAWMRMVRWPSRFVSMDLIAEVAAGENEENGD